MSLGYRPPAPESGKASSGRTLEDFFSASAIEHSRAMLCAAQLPIPQDTKDMSSTTCNMPGYRPPAPKSGERTLENLLNIYRTGAIEHSLTALKIIQQKPRSFVCPYVGASVPDVMAKQATEAEVLRPASASVVPAPIVEPAACPEASSLPLIIPAAAVEPAACPKASSQPLPSPAGSLEALASVQQVAAEAPLTADIQHCLKAGKAPCQPITRIKPEWVGPLDAEASRKTLGDDDISHFIDTINVDDFIARPFSPAQDPSAGSFGYVPIFFSMEGSSSHRSSTCSSQGSCSGSSTSQMSWSSASSSSSANGRVSRSSGSSGSDYGFGRGKAQPLSHEDSVRVRVSSSDCGSPRHSVVARRRVSNTCSAFPCLSPQSSAVVQLFSPCSSPSTMSLGGAPVSSSDHLPSAGGQWACRQPASVAPHPVEQQATYHVFEAQLMARVEARRARMQRGSSCGGGSVGEAGAACPADAFLETDQSVEGVKESAGGSSSVIGSRVTVPPPNQAGASSISISSINNSQAVKGACSQAGSDTIATKVKASVTGNFSSSSNSSKAKAKGTQPARNKAAAAAPKKKPTPTTPKAAGAAGAAASSAPVPADVVAGRRRKNS